MTELPLRFWAKVDKTDGCWLWLGRCSAKGYGRILVDGKQVLVHRLVYMALVGPIPEGLTIDHVLAWGCTHKNCVNPAHLEPVTIGENVRRSTRTVNKVPTHGTATMYTNGCRCADCREGWRAYTAERTAKRQADPRLATVSPNGAADLTGLPREDVISLIERGDLPASGHPVRYRIRLRDIDAYLTARSAA